MPIPQLIKQDAALAYVGEELEKLTPEQIREKRRDLKIRVKKVGGKVVTPLGPRDVKYRKEDLDKLLAA